MLCCCCFFYVGFLSFFFFYFFSSLFCSCTFSMRFNTFCSILLFSSCAIYSEKPPTKGILLCRVYATSTVKEKFSLIELNSQTHKQCVLVMPWLLFFFPLYYCVLLNILFLLFFYTIASMYGEYAYVCVLTKCVYGQR